MEREDPHVLHDVYRDMVQLIGYDNMLKMFEYYKGQQINFPVRMYSKEYIQQKLTEEFDGQNVRQLARETGYSERWVRRLIKQYAEMAEQTIP